MIKSRLSLISLGAFLDESSEMLDENLGTCRARARGGSARAGRGAGGLQGRAGAGVAPCAAALPGGERRDGGFAQPGSEGRGREGGGAHEGEWEVELRVALEEGVQHFEQLARRARRLERRRVEAATRRRCALRLLLRLLRVLLLLPAAAAAALLRWRRCLLVHVVPRARELALLRELLGHLLATERADVFAHLPGRSAARSGGRTDRPVRRGARGHVPSARGPARAACGCARARATFERLSRGTSLPLS